MVSRKNDDLIALIEELRSGRQPANDGFVSAKSLNVLVMGILAAVGALVWSNVTDKPVQDAQTFAVIQQQTAEIRTTVLEMRSTLSGINERLENNTKNTSDLQSRVSAIETQVEANAERIDKLEDVNRGRP